MTEPAAHLARFRHSMPEVAITRRIAQWVVGFSADHAPVAVSREAHRSALDTIGVSIAGMGHLSCQHMRDLASSQYGPGPCTVLGSPASGSSLSSALVNGTAAHILDFDDVSYDGMVHASAVVWPATLAAAELGAVSGRQTLDAFIAGVEVHCALGRALSHQMFWRGFWTTGLLGSVAAAASAAKALSLGVEATRSAIDIAVAQASGLRAIVGTPMKAIACGLAAESGLKAALMARAGIQGPADVFAGRYGFAAMLNDGVMHEAEIARLGMYYVLAEAPMAFKQFPICSYGQAAVEALLDAKTELDEPGTHVVCEVHAAVVDNMPYGRPTSTTEAQFSLSFALANALVFSGLAPAHLTDATLAEPRISAALDRIEVRVATGPAAATLGASNEGAIVTMHAPSGRQVSRTVRVPAGMPQRPLSDAQLQAKFRACTVPAIGEKAASGLARRVEHMQDLANIRELFA